MPAPRFENLSDIRAFAIKREIAAAEGYSRMAEQAKMPGLRALLLELKGEEEKHRKLLEGLTEAELAQVTVPPVEDMGLSDALADEPMDNDMTFQELLIFAAKKEKKAEDLYAGLARLPEAAAYKSVFEFLAGQERTHKLKLEAEYERHVLSED
jgi:rubrerythrin